MDESFSDFQEKKKCNTGPKNTQKTKVKSVKRKPTKKIKNQKDIRVFVKGKENELVSYTKKFNEVCEKSGLDVNSEQLQLAIALSKSLQHCGFSVDEHRSQEETPISSEERSARIKLTLQEYGFKVPTAKTTTNKRKKLKKLYKLLLLTEAEKKQIITDRYCKILGTNSYKLLEDNIQFNFVRSELFYKATNIPFENIKNNEIFYVKDLNLDISHSISSLRDWSQIPGRPLSPTIKVNNFKFINTNLTQEELDLILSGALKNIQDIIENKSEEQIIQTETMGVENIEISVHADVEVEDINEKSQSLSNSSFKNISATDRLSLQNIVSVQRSISPDIFDDDITILEYTPAKSNEVYDKKDNETCFMDLTECVAINNVDVCKSKVNIYHENNISKRKSNDYMDITECVSSSKQMCIENIDLTQPYIPFEENNVNKSENSVKKSYNNKTMSNKENIETLDLTQYRNTVTEIIELNENENDSADDTIIINDNIDKRDNILVCEKSFSSDNDAKNQSVNISNKFQNKNETWNATEYTETVPIDQDAILIEEKNCSPTYTYTDHVFEHSYIYDYDNFDDNSQEIGINNNSSDDNSILKKSTEDNLTKSDAISKNLNSDKRSCSSINNETSVSHEKIVLEHFKSATNNDNDLSGCYKYNEPLQMPDTEINNEISNIAKEIDTKEIDTEKILLNGADENGDQTNHANQLEDYNDYVFEHSYIYDYDDRNSLNVKSNNDDENEIDLTQTSDVESSEIKDNLGKIDNISVDYDEVIVIENVGSNNISKFSSLPHDKEASNCSKNSEVFEVSDKEFNYSLHQSRFDNYDDDGFIDMETAAGKSCTLNRSMSENDLNLKDDKKIKTKNASHNTTPVKALSQDVKTAIMQTPNNDYIIKTRDVTPMADYASMASPERNEELKRYGLKPFKRKRAIQLLTYLYNQTHPVVESYEEISSPAKRLKYDAPKQKSPRKSPKKSQTSKSPLKSCDLRNIEATDNSLYIQTKELPDIKEIHSDPEDWVFQTREKSKVHSCRVPLHIAFHNYVTCRRYLRESILRYEPVNIDVIHKELVSIGYRYNPKDLLKFMDKKCITVKTTDNNARNKR